MSHSAKWIQYSYDDPKEAAVMMVADSRDEALEDNEIHPDCPWYSYDLVWTDEGEKMKNSDGPHYLKNEGNDGE